jgi:hypothetical protein
VLALREEASVVVRSLLVLLHFPDGRTRYDRLKFEVPEPSSQTDRPTVPALGFEEFQLFYFVSL